MSTPVSTDAPVPVPAAPTVVSRGWAVVGIVAALTSGASVFLSMSLSPEYVPGSVITSEIMDAGFAEKRPLLVAFHITTVVSALLLVVFAAGLHRRLQSVHRTQTLAPTIALVGIALVSVAQLLGSGLDTEFLFGVGDTAINLPSDIGMYSHWIATIPWLWAGAGIAALAAGASRRGALVPAWLAVVSIILGGLTVLIAVSPLQYMSAGPGILWLLIASLGFTLGDRALRRKS
ncbi:lysylphosphatidylglycerol synthetase-like protein (DUF2156 family) [Microbacteriaceae bacterium SG_E_30_P1]|uniref:Lysylphosphatidylglycerol synthetase-like protein (DUF2156 family) n=1 Tax=Antiquaquibacter oligotrophicus TaxID=2880260 RepID=A0ABT6KPF5_9MICO|nr:hypothetical protein [Antiquaquibacter oligotrophicus]MDH6181059.1 lysylphosphatidylglycerol synthetase-like protein (DUF2156 family) [Antiquaquibacter oligotrophicus]UDF13243.1 hypothetical protein LH407_13955 [Antiquaquibacter oligotrophicus]